MAEPRIAEKSPAVLKLAPGTYWFCQCGQSANQPFCDGSHAGTEFSPLEFTVEKEKTYALCRCKRTGNSPYCDGTHAKL